MGSDVNFSTFVNQVQTMERINAITLWYKVNTLDNIVKSFQ